MMMCLYYITNTKAADDLVMQGAQAISKHGIDLILLKYSNLWSRRRMITVAANNSFRVLLLLFTENLI